MTCTPAPASSSPATAGPTIAPVWNSDWKIALEAGSRSIPTRPGSIAFLAELSMPLCDAVIAGSRNNGHRAGPKSAFSASPALQHAQIPSTRSSSLRRSGDRVHLERHRDGGQLVAEDRYPEPGDQRTVIARPPQRGDVEQNVPGHPLGCSKTHARLGLADIPTKISHKPR